MPTNVTPMLKYRTNLNVLQTVGQFNGKSVYIYILTRSIPTLFANVHPALIEVLSHFRSLYYSHCIYECDIIT